MAGGDAQPTARPVRHRPGDECGVGARHRRRVLSQTGEADPHHCVSRGPAAPPGSRAELTAPRHAGINTAAGWSRGGPIGLGLSMAAAMARLWLHTPPPQLRGRLRANLQQVHGVARAYLHRDAYGTRDRPPINSTDKPCGQREGRSRSRTSAACAMAEGRANANLAVEVKGLEPSASTLRMSGSRRYDQVLSEEFPGSG